MVLYLLWNFADGFKFAWTNGSENCLKKKKKKTKEGGIYICAGLQFMLCLIMQPSMRRVIEGYSYQTTVQREVCVISVQFRAELSTWKTLNSVKMIILCVVSLI